MVKATFKYVMNAYSEAPNDLFDQNILDLIPDTYRSHDYFDREWLEEEKRIPGEPHFPPEQNNDY